MAKYDVELVPSAEEDLKYYRVPEQRLIIKAILTYLEEEADIPTRKRKQLRENPVAPWELRVGKCRVFYKVSKNQEVKVLAIGHKRHNELLIRGEKVEL